MVDILDLIVDDPPCGVDRLRLGGPLWEGSRGLSYRFPIVINVALLSSGYISKAFVRSIITAFIVSEVLFETLKGEEKVLKKALR